MATDSLPSEDSADDRPLVASAPIRLVLEGNSKDPELEERVALGRLPDAGLEDELPRPA